MIGSRLAKTLLVTLGILGVCVAGASAQSLPPLLEAGYKAGFLCSGVFVAGRDPKDIAREELAKPDGTAMSMDGITIDRERSAVYVTYARSDTPRIAAYVTGLGTVLLPPGETLRYLEKLPKVAIPMPAGDAAEISWPDGDLLPDTPLDSEIDREKLSRSIDDAFAGAQYQPAHTIGVVVVYNGRIVAERYAPTWDMHTQYRTWSTAKSIANALVGVLVGEGKLAIDQSAPIPEWQGDGDPRSGITLNHLMHMSSGLRSRGAMTLVGYWGGIDTAKDAAESPFQVEPDTRWKYANYDTLLLVKSIKEVLANETEYLTFPRRALLNKIGMRHTFPEIDAYGNFILSSQVYSTPRDLARLGLLFLNDGVWNSERILPEGWVAYTTTPAPAKKPGGRDYGAQFWLMNHDERVPKDTYTTSGSRGQYSTIVPSRNVVVSRMGIDPRIGGHWDQEGFVAAVLSAIR